MKVIKTLFFLLLACFFASCASTEKRTTLETRIDADDRGGTARTKMITDNELLSVRKKWETEYISAVGYATVLNRYDSDSRNKQLARRGAIVDAQRTLASKISSTRVTEKVTMRDLEVSDFVRTELQATISNVSIVHEEYDSRENQYIVHIQMPKKRMIHILEEYISR